MCIIWIKNKGLDLPKKEIIQTMFDNNSHGGGFAYSDNSQVIIKKGFMDFESYYSALKEIPNIKNINLVGHCRITTHGSTSKENCHPFPLSDKIKDLKATEIRTSVGVIHNGIIRSVEADKENDLSDTMTYIKDVLYAKYEADKSFMDKEAQREVIQKEINSKMVIMKDNGEYFTIGDFNTDSNGYIYSNYSYVPYDYNLQWSEEEEEDDIFAPFVTLRETDFIIVEGHNIYGDEEYLILTENGVYMDNWDNMIKVANYAFDSKGAIIKLNKRLMEEEEGVIF